MNILFLTITKIGSVKERGIYTDLMREFIRRGHRVYIAAPTERRYGQKTHLIEEDGCEILNIRTLNIQKTNIVEKGIGTILLESQFNRAISRQWPGVKFDIILYSTPPITFNKVIERQQRRTGAPTYLMLKDIFPQNAVDLGMFSTGSIFYRMFRRKERSLYRLSDRIGCMSPANARYVVDHNPDVDPAKVEQCPNAVELIAMPDLIRQQKEEILQKYGLPIDRTIYVYGGNLGKPQGIDFLLKVIEANEERSDSYIAVVGNGTEYNRMERWFAEHRPRNAKLLARLQKEDYDRFVRSCHVGLIFLDPRFTIPNFPSRLLSYLENSMPVLLATDTNTDIGVIACENNFGLWSRSGDVAAFMANMDRMTPQAIVGMGKDGRRFLEENYTVDKAADKILAVVHK